MAPPEAIKLLQVEIDYMLGTTLALRSLYNYRLLTDTKYTPLFFWGHIQTHRGISIKSKLKSEENSSIKNKVGGKLNPYPYRYTAGITGIYQFNNETSNYMVQSARNFSGSSETIRQSSEKKFLVGRPAPDLKFNKWFAGVLDGDGHFDVRNINGQLTLKAIKIKLHNRDIRILNRILNTQHMGRIKIEKNKPYSYYIVSTSFEMKEIVSIVNGLIRLFYFKSFSTEQLLLLFFTVA